VELNYESLVRHLRDGSLVAFLGAGASRTYDDVSTGRSWIGLPTARGLVEVLAARRSYISLDLTFPEACFLLKSREGRGELEKQLLEFLDKPVIQPLPAHVILANLPFPAFVTTNYDTLLERALLDAKRKPHSVIEDEDVSRLRPIHVPVIKLHGCVTRPGTLVAAEDEYHPIHETRPIVDALLKTHLANKVLLFVGFSLDDVDFALAFDEIRVALGDRMPRSFAVVNSSSSYRAEYWLSKGVTLIPHDLTDFLRGLLRASAGSEPPGVYHPGEDWFKNAFFESLHKIRTLPSETQVVDAFLEHLLEEMNSPNFSLEDVLDRASQAAATVLARRPHFEGLRKICAALVEEIRNTCLSKDAGELAIRGVIEQRMAVGRGISLKGNEIVSRGDSILLFSQSVRVIQFLKGVPRGVQNTCHLYVAECRPKSPSSFQDAVSICESLIGSGYEMTIVPDAAIGNLIDRRQINTILLGAHEIFCRESEPVAFVNTCGTRMIVDAAERADVPVYVIADSSKIADESIDGDPNVSFDEEEDLFSGVAGVISDLKASGQKVSCLNIGYDLSPFRPNVHLVTEV
jgi:translation initiation factor 2B subunit (eIF-2B alpha/beta/delta family)